MPKPPSPLAHLWIELAALALAAAGFWLVPEDPALPALLLTAVALPLALLGGLAMWIAERREKARAGANRHSTRLAPSLSPLPDGERAGERGYGLRGQSPPPNPLTPSLSPPGRGKGAELVNVDTA